MAQGRGNFDPAQMKQMRLDRLKEQMAVTDDAEWKVIESAAGKVMDAQMDAMASRFGGMGRGGRGGGGTGGGTRSMPPAVRTVLVAVAGRFWHSLRRDGSVAKGD